MAAYVTCYDDCKKNESLCEKLTFDCIFQVVANGIFNAYKQNIIVSIPFDQLIKLITDILTRGKMRMIICTRATILCNIPIFNKKYTIEI